MQNVFTILLTSMIDPKDKHSWKYRSVEKNTAFIGGNGEDPKNITKKVLFTNRTY
jgi:hypothetical protein